MFRRVVRLVLHAGEPVAGPVSRGRVLAGVAEVFDGQPGAAGLVGEADLDTSARACLRMLVSASCATRYRVSRPSGARSRSSPSRRQGRHAAVALELGGQDGEPFGSGQRVSPEHADGAAGFLEPGLGQPLGSPIAFAELRVRAPRRGEQRAPSRFSTRPDSEWASTSCTSRARRWRSASAAARACAARVCSSSASSYSARSCSPATGGRTGTGSRRPRSPKSFRTIPATGARPLAAMPPRPPRRQRRPPRRPGVPAAAGPPCRPRGTRRGIRGRPAGGHERAAPATAASSRESARRAGRPGSGHMAAVVAARTTSRRDGDRGAMVARGPAGVDVGRSPRTRRRQWPVRGSPGRPRGRARAASAAVPGAAA